MQEFSGYVLIAHLLTRSIFVFVILSNYVWTVIFKDGIHNLLSEDEVEKVFGTSHNEGNTSDIGVLTLNIIKRTRQQQQKRLKMWNCVKKAWNFPAWHEVKNLTAPAQNLKLNIDWTW